MRHGAGQQLDLPAIQLGVHAIAVVLDLVNQSLRARASSTGRVGCGLIHFRDRLVFPTKATAAPRTARRNPSIPCGPRRRSVPEWMGHRDLVDRRSIVTTDRGLAVGSPWHYRCCAGECGSGAVGSHRLALSPTRPRRWLSTEANHAYRRATAGRSTRIGNCSSA